MESDNLSLFAERESMMERKRDGRRVKKIIRVVRAITPQLFDLKDKFVKACLDGKIDVEEWEDILKEIEGLKRSMRDARREEIEDGK